MNKKVLTERDICTKFCTTTVKQTGRDKPAQLRPQVHFTKELRIIRGKRVTRGKLKLADYILNYRPNIPIAHIEVKRH